MNDLEELINIEHNPTPDEIFKHLTYTTDLLTSNKIIYWIVYGTLLGAVRQNDIIPYDYDFDIGIEYDDYEKILNLNSEISKDNYSFVKGKNVLYEYKNHKNSIYGFKMSLKIMFNENPVGDMYIYHKCEDEFMRRYDPKEQILFWPNSTFPYAFINTLIDLKIRDKTFKAPSSPKSLLIHWYGETWTEPIKANSQGGPGFEDYDYYGSYKYSQLNFLIKEVKENFGLELKKNFDLSKVKYIFPLDQINWIKDNELNRKSNIKNK